MKRLDDIKIGRKFGLVLGGCVLLVAFLSGLSLWAIRALADDQNDAHGRYQRSMLVSEAARGISEAFSYVQPVLSGFKSSQQDREQLLQLRQNYLAKLDAFQAGATSAKGRQLAQEMEDLAHEFVSDNERAIELASTGHRAEGLLYYETKSFPLYRSLMAKADDTVAVGDQLIGAAMQRQQATTSHAWLVIIIAGIAALILAITGGVLITRNIVQPLRLAVAYVNCVAAGDLTRDTRVEFRTRHDEIGELSKAVTEMVENLRKMISEVSSGVQVLSSSSAQLSTDSNQVSTGSQETSNKAHTVAAAAEQMTANVASVAAGMEQTTANLGSVTSNTEQMTATISEIAANSEKARRITEEATRQAVRITEQINQLGAAAREIGKVTETITEISSQTNLLALNATIEAARAGAAGKGFAVVANEIKALAQQTAAATEDIKVRIGGVQSSTGGSIAEIEKVSKVIQDVSEIVSSIAAAIEEQATMTKEIAHNIAEASTGVRDANQRVAEASQATSSIAQAIVTVDQTAGQITSASEHVRDSATGLAQVAKQLQTAVGHFRVAA